LVCTPRYGRSHPGLCDLPPSFWEQNVTRLGIDLSTIEIITLSHWHRDHSGGMLKAIQMITEAKGSNNQTPEVQVDLHPDRPDFRGFKMGPKIISMQADPSFAEINAAGGVAKMREEGHTVLDDFFHISGYIPKVVGYEKGLENGMRYSQQTGKWEIDEAVTDERFLICNLRGTLLFLLNHMEFRSLFFLLSHCMNHDDRMIQMLCWTNNMEQVKESSSSLGALIEAL